MIQENPSPPEKAPVLNPNAYHEYLAEREEILRYKWLESEKAGGDISWETALVDWVNRHRETWLRQRKEI